MPVLPTISDGREAKSIWGNLVVVKILKALPPCLALALGTNLWAADLESRATPPESTYSGLHWREIGPFRGGRAVAVAGVPGSPNVFYFGAAAGGVWKTIDAGATWKPIFDAERASSIGAIAVARSNPDIIYVGTGEANMRGNVTWSRIVSSALPCRWTWLASLGPPTSRLP